MKLLNLYIKKEKTQFIIYFLIFLKALIFITQNMLAMFILKNIIDKDLKQSIIYIFSEIMLFVLSVIIDYIYFNLREIYLENIKISLVEDICFNILSQKNKQLNDKEKYLSWILNDVNTIKNSYFLNIYAILYDVILVTFIAIMLFWFNKYIFFFNFFGVILMFFLTKILNEKIENIQYNLSKEKETNVKYVTNLYENIYKFFLSNKIINFANRINKYNNKYLNEFMKSTKKLNLVICELTILSLFIQVINVAITIILILQNKLIISSFFPICTFSAYFCNKINEIVESYMEMNNSKKIYEKYSKEIIYEEHFDKKIENISLIEFKDISINSVLKDFNFSINKGDKCLIVGESGSGKSTIINLLLKNIEDYMGDILINSINLKTIDKKSIYNQIEYINSDNFIFYTNYYNNISVYDENYDKNLIDKIMKKLDINTIPLNVEENNLSLGQKQRLNLAKIFYNNKDIIILDEATSNLDSENRKNIENLLLESDKTIILITHHYDLEYTKKFNKVKILKKEGEYIEN